MRNDGDLRPLAQTLGSAALGVGIGLGVLIVGFAVSQMTLPASNIVASSTSTPTAAAVRSGSPVPQPATPAQTAHPTPSPAPTPDPLVVTAFEGQGLRLAALTIPAGYTMTSPIAGTIKIALYQFISGEIRVASSSSSAPVYPYVFVTSADRELKLRPGAVGRDVDLIVKDGETVAAGAPLFKTIGTGASSWRTFYDGGVTAQVIASVIVLPSGEEVDPVPVFKK